MKAGRAWNGVKKEFRASPIRTTAYCLAVLGSIWYAMTVFWGGRLFVANYVLPVVLFGLLELLILVAAILDLRKAQDCALLSTIFAGLMACISRLNEKARALLEMIPDSPEKQHYVADHPARVDFKFYALVGIVAMCVCAATLVVITVTKTWKTYRDSQSEVK